MSRHRNVRNMIAEEDYYDDYGDDYDDYDAMPAMQPASKKKKKKKKNAADGSGNTNAGTTTTTTTTNTAAAAPKKVAANAKPPTAPRSALLTVLPAASSKATTSTTAAAASTTAALTSASVTTATTATPPMPAFLLEKRAKPTLTLVILGHVDAGKSTLTGQLLWATQSAGGTRARPPANMAWLLDEDEQERQHGVTIEVATKVLITDRFEIVLQDAPGHADYVPSMITGTASADAAVVVVDATDFHTSFRAGQLREHLCLAKGLGIPQLIVAINKMDLLEWNADTYLSMQSELQDFLHGQLGYNVAQKVHFLPLSGLTGINVVQKPADIPELTSWYTGPTLWQTLDKLDPPTVGPKLLEKPLRMLITDVTGEVGKGIAVRAKVASGWIGQGQTVVVSPVQDETTIYKMTRIQLVEGSAAVLDNSNDNTNNERESYAVAGELWDLVLTGLDISRISTGNILARPGALPPLTTRCRAKIFVLEGLTVPIIRGAQAILHMHYLDVPCHLSALLRTLKPNGTAVLKERPRVLTAKVQAIVEITLHYPIAMEAFSDCRALGRFVLRRSGASIAVGRVEEVLS